jgi:hypothetical protein
MPALVCRFDRGPVIVRIPFAAYLRMVEGVGAYEWDYHCECGFEAFCMLVREILAVEERGRQKCL